MVMLTTTIFLLLALVAIQMVMILHAELITKYIISMRDQCGRRIPSFTGPGTRTGCMKNCFHGYLDEGDDDDDDDDDDDYSNYSTGGASASLTDIDVPYVSDAIYRFDDLVCPRYPES